MIRPKANEMPSRSEPVIAGVDLPARTRVATTEPGPTRTSRAVPSVSANARWGRVYSCMRYLSLNPRHIRQCRMQFGANVLPSTMSVNPVSGRWRPGVQVEVRASAGDVDRIALARARRRGRCAGGDASGAWRVELRAPRGRAAGLGRL